MNFIILAAGVGSRLMPLTQNIPKCCVEINNLSLIERLLIQINKFFVENNVVIVSGYKKNFLNKKLLEKSWKYQIIENIDYQNTNNMYSAYLANQRIIDNKDVIIVNADCIYSDNILKVISQCKESTIFIDQTKFDKEGMKVKIENGFVQKMNKSLGNFKNNYLSIDIYYFKYSDYECLHLIFEKYIRKNDVNQWTETAINDLVNENKRLIRAKDIEGEKWFEIDTIEDLEKAKKIWAKE